MKPHSNDSAADTSPDDALLKRLLREAGDAPPAGLEALNARVLDQWRDQCGASMAQPQGPAAVLKIASLLGRRPVWIAASGLLVAGLIMAGLWAHRPEPPLDDLLEPDVLSQMAAGEL